MLVTSDDRIDNFQRILDVPALRSQLCQFKASVRIVLLCFPKLHKNLNGFILLIGPPELRREIQIRELSIFRRSRFRSILQPRYQIGQNIVPFEHLVDIP